MNPKLWNFAPLMVWEISVLAMAYFGKRPMDGDDSGILIIGGGAFWIIVACYLNS